MGEKVGVVGIGLMGQAITERLLSQSLEVAIYNRSNNEKVEHLSKLGAQVCHNLADLFDLCEQIIFIVSNFDAINALISAIDLEKYPNKIIIQMSTISPEESRTLDQKITASGLNYLEAPVLGSIPEAGNGSLIIMAGGKQSSFEASNKLLSCLGNNISFVGDTGTASALKLAMNQLIAALTSAFSLSLAFIQKNGVSADTFMDVVRDSALYAKTYDKKLDKYLSRDFGKANFSTQHLLKDVRLFLEDGKKLNLDVSQLEAIEKITNRAVKNGHAQSDYSSIYSEIFPEKTK